MKLGKLSLVASLLLINTVSQSVLADVSGTVYRELPVNGIVLNTYGVQDVNETNGIAGIDVVVTGDNSTTETVQTDASGNWTTTAGAFGSNVRVEFSNIPSYLSFGPKGVDSNTSIQFVTDGTSNINLGVHIPSDYSSTADPQLASVQYTNGDPDATGANEAGLEPGLHIFNESSSGQPATGSLSVANVSDMGAVYGVAHQKSSNTIFMSAVIKRHSGLGTISVSDGPTTGGIYAYDSVNGVQPWLDINTLAGVDTGADPRTETPVSVLPADPLAPNRDAQAFFTAGKRAIGDMDVTPDDKELVLINMEQKTLVFIDIATKALSGSPVAIPENDCPTVDDARPWGLGQYQGKIYVGVTCTGETTQSTDDLRAIIYEYDGSSFTSVLQFDLNHPRGKISGLGNPGEWQPWNVTALLTTAESRTPTPILTDIEFDIDGSMMIGINDRTGFVAGSFNSRTDTSTALIEGITGGDIIRACISAGSWLLESNASCGGVSTAGVGNNEGLGGGEFYFQDKLPGSSFHEETSWPGLGFLPGSGRVATVTMDPVTLRSGGVFWYDNTSGEQVQALELYPRSFSGTPTTANFSKVVGLGDLEYLTDSAPLEIGNRIWDDTNSNGMQDANEAGINGILVTLTCGGLTATATSGADGSWIITDGDMTGGIDIPRDTSCTISVPTTEPSGNSLTTQTLNTTLGSDPDSSGSFTFTTGRSGQNNHTYDIGYSNVPPVVGCTTIINNASITAVDQTDTDATNDTASASADANCATPEADLELIKTADKSTVFKGDTLIYTLTLTNKGVSDATDVEVTDTLPANVTFVSATAPAGTSFDNATKVWTIPSLPAASGSNVLALQIEVTIN